MPVQYPSIQPFFKTLLEVDTLKNGDTVKIYVEMSGNKTGIPVIYLHGGPGDHSDPSIRRLFNPKVFNIIQFDQRGCGQSVPLNHTEKNTTQHLIKDMEAIRKLIQVPKFLVAGGSWGTTLALAYAEAHPVLGLILRGVFDLSNSAAYRGMVLEPELKYSYRGKEGWNWGAGISAIAADQSMQSLLYSVTAAQATASRAAYQAQAGLMALRLSGSLSYPLSSDARLLVFGRVDSVQGAANQASPLVRQNTGTSVGAVLVYTWKQSEARASE
jgi:pimeloyl-ACP methyl ester carboxylesterase